MVGTFIATEKFAKSGFMAEKEMWRSLTKSFAEEPCLAYWRYPLFSKVGENRKEPDILVLHQTLGVIIIEVKALTIDNIESIDGHQWQYNNFYQDQGNPYEQCENHLYDFLAMSDRQPKLRRRVSGRALVSLPNITRVQWQEKGFDQHPCCPPVIFKDDLNSGLIALITDASCVRSGQPLDDGKWQKLCHVAGNTTVIKPLPSKNIDTVITKSEAIAKSREILIDLDKEQEKAAKQIPDGPQRIRGIAGSGKTVLLCQKAAQMHLKNPGWDIAIVFFTRSLYDTITHLVDSYIRQFTQGEESYHPSTSRLKIFHAWGAKDQPGLYREVCHTLNHHPLSAGDRSLSSTKSPTAKLCIAINQMKSTLDRKGKDIPGLYDAILIDEGQDLVIDPEHKEHGIQPFYWMAYNFCKPVIKPASLSLFDEAPEKSEKKNDLRRLIWAYDEAQSLESPVIPSAKEAFGTDFSNMLLGNYEGNIQKSIIMHRCYRTPAPILTAAHAIGMGLLREEGMISGVSSKADWENLGYEVSGRFTPGSNITLKRPKVNSPNPMPDISKHFSIKLELYDNEQQEAQSIAKKIAEDIKTQKLTPEKQLMVIVLSRNIIDPIKQALKEQKIDYYVPSAIQTNSKPPVYPEKNQPNKFWHKGAVTISSIYKAKGNEADMVYVMGIDSIASHENSVKHRNQLFVAMTRAKGWVHISGLDQPLPFYDELKRVIEAKGIYQFIFKRDLQRDLTDTDSVPHNNKTTTKLLEGIS